MTFVLLAHGIAALLLGLLFKVQVVFPLAVFIALEAVLLLVAGHDGVLRFLIVALCITQGCYVLGVVLRAVLERARTRRRTDVRGKPSNEFD